MIEKVISNFNFLLVFISKIKLNFHYKKMAEKMYNNLLQEICKNNVLLILKECKALRNFDFISTIRKKIHWVVQLIGNKVIERFIY